MYPLFTAPLPPVLLSSCCATLPKEQLLFPSSAAPAAKAMIWRNTDMGKVDSDGRQALRLVVQPTVVVVLAILALIRNCLTPPHLLSTFSWLENSTENRGLGEMINYRPAFENHSPWQSFSGAWPSWDIAPPNSPRRSGPNETQSEGCRIWPGV